MKKVNNSVKMEKKHNNNGMCSAPDGQETLKPNQIQTTNFQSET